MDLVAEYLENLNEEATPINEGITTLILIGILAGIYGYNKAKEIQDKVKNDPDYKKCAKIKDKKQRNKCIGQISKKYV